MKLESYVRSIEEVAVLAESHDPALTLEDRAFDTRLKEAQIDIENNGRIVGDGNIKDHVLWKLGFLAGLKWRGQLRFECRKKLGKGDDEPQSV